MGLVKNSAFYNYTLNFNGRLIRHGDDYHKDYLTDLIANDSLAFFKQSKNYHPNKLVNRMHCLPGINQFSLLIILLNRRLGWTKSTFNVMLETAQSMIRLFWIVFCVKTYVLSYTQSQVKL